MITKINVLFCQLSLLQIYSIPSSFHLMNKVLRFYESVKSILFDFFVLVILLLKIKIIPNNELMRESSSSSISRILLTLVNVAICVFALCIVAYYVYFGAFAAGWSGKNVTWFSLIYEAKGFLLVGILAFIAVVGQTEKRKIGFIAGLGLSLAAIFSILFMLFFGLRQGHLFLDETNLILFMVYFGSGTGLFFWTKNEFHQKHKITRYDWIYVTILAVVCSFLLLVDFYFA